MFNEEKDLAKLNFIKVDFKYSIISSVEQSEKLNKNWEK